MIALAPEPPLFDAHAPVATALSWMGLPAVLRRALSRSIQREVLEHVSFIDSVRSPDPRFREWQVGLLALDIGVDLHDARRDNLVGLFSNAELAIAPMTRFCVHGVGPRQGFGASFRAPTPTGASTVCAAAYVYFTDTGLAESAFVFMAGPAPTPILQLPATMLEEHPLDVGHLARALDSVAGQIAAPGRIADATTVLKEALVECLTSAREQQW